MLGLRILGGIRVGGRIEMRGLRGLKLRILRGRSKMVSQRMGAGSHSMMGRAIIARSTM